MDTEKPGYFEAAVQKLFEALRIHNVQLLKMKDAISRQIDENSELQNLLETEIQVGDLKKINSNLTNDLRNKEDRVVACSRKIELMSKKIVSLESMKHKLEQEVSNAKEEHEKCTDIVYHLKKKIMELTSNVAKLCEENEKKEHLLEKLTKQKESFEKQTVLRDECQITSLKKKFRTVQQEAKRLRDEEGESEDEIEMIELEQGEDFEDDLRSVQLTRDTSVHQTYGSCSQSPAHVTHQGKMRGNELLGAPTGQKRKCSDDDCGSDISTDYHEAGLFGEVMVIDLTESQLSPTSRSSTTTGFTKTTMSSLSGKACNSTDVFNTRPRVALSYYSHKKVTFSAGPMICSYDGDDSTSVPNSPLQEKLELTSYRENVLNKRQIGHKYSGISSGAFNREENRKN